MNAAQPDHRKVYAKGFFDGLRAGGEMLTEQRQREKLDSLSSIERKIFDSTQRMESWTSQKVGSEIYRKTRASVDIKAIGSGLNKLQNIGLVVEGPKGQFRQSPIKLVQDTKPLAISDLPRKEDLTLPQIDAEAPVDALGRVGAKLRIAAAGLSDLADEVDRCAIELQDFDDQNANEITKLRQLKELLGSLK